MRSTLYPPRPLHTPSVLSQWLGRLAVVAVTVALGLVIGMQYVEPNIRVLAVAAAVIVVGVAWRLDMISALGVLIMALPFPRGTVFGSTNLALILLIGILYLLRWTQREVPAPSSSPAFPPVAAFFLTVVLSFYNVTSMKNLYFALQNFQLFVGTLVMFWLIVQNTRNEQDLKRLVGFQVASTLVIALIAMWELNNPGGTLVPGWISFSATAGSETGSNMRVGSMFYDFELLADFCGISLLLLTFLFMRARGGNERGFLGFMIVLMLFTLFATVTRGAIVSLLVAAAYLTFLMRRHVRLVPFTLIVTLLVSAFLAMNWYVASFTNAGNLFMRMENSEFVGWMPDSRAGAWTDAWERWQIHPLLGHGIYYSAERGGLKFWYWPHNLYLYILNCVGLVGLAVWLWLMATFFRMTRPLVDRLDHPSYAHAFLLVAHAQLVFFLVDQFKIEFWRNPIYQFQVWLMFALWAAAHRVASRTPLTSEARR